MSAENILPFPSKNESEEIEVVESVLRYAKVSHDITEGLAKNTIPATESRVLWAIIRKTYGFKKSWDRISASQLAELTEMTPQRASSALCGLIEKGIVIRKGGSFGELKINPNSAEWKIKKKVQKSVITRNINSCSLNTNPVKPSNTNPVNTRDTIRDNIRDKDIVSFSEENNAPLKRSKISNCPHQKILDLYHEILPELPQVKILSPKRKSSLKARWVQDKKFQTIDFWQRMFAYVRKNDFLMGRVQPPAGRRVFMADFDFLISPDGFVKILEGKYEN